MNLNNIKLERISDKLKEIIDITNNQNVCVGYAEPYFPVGYNVYVTVFDKNQTPIIHIFKNSGEIISVSVHKTVYDTDLNFLQTYFDEYFGQKINLLHKNIYSPNIIEYYNVSLKTYLTDVKIIKK